MISINSCCFPELLWKWRDSARGTIAWKTVVWNSWYVNLRLETVRQFWQKNHLNDIMEISRSGIAVAENQNAKPDDARQLKS